MSVINSIPLIAAGDDGYQISRSVRLRSSASAYFNRTPASAGNRKTWTWSGWMKRGGFSSNSQYVFHTSLVGSTTAAYMYFDPTAETIRYWDGSLLRASTQSFRDPSAWYHIVVAFDSTQATANNRVRMYVNGIEITSFSTLSNPSLNYDSFINSTTAHYFGTSGVNPYDGYLTEINFIDGQALTPSSFGQNNPITGVWEPMQYTGTYGTNGFYLNFSDPSGATATTIGKDYSGNGNNWTPNNISVTAGVTYDSMIDTPTPYADGGNGRGNYAVLNPLLPSGAAPSNGNLNFSITNSTNNARGTIDIPTTGKWYWEITVTALGGGDSFVGIMRSADPYASGDSTGATSGSYVYRSSTGTKLNNGSSSAYGATWTTNDLIGVAFDADAGTLTFYKNNTSQGVAFSGLVGVYTALLGITTSSTNSFAINFGQRPFAYTPPTGFKALNTQNLPEPTIKKGNLFFDATLYTGTGASQSITNSGGVQPDWVWIKSRNNASNNALIDSVRGGNKVLISELTDAEYTGTYLSSFDSHGFTIGATASSALNASGYTYVGWQWKAGGTPAVTNTAGSITSTVSAGVTQGFSVVTYTGTGANLTFGHGLGVKPAMVIVKPRSFSDNWVVWNKNLPTPTTGYLYLNGTGAAANFSGFWNSTEPTSTVVSIGVNSNTNTNGGTFVAYCFAEVPGFSRFGSYTGNGSADGPFLYCGFRPKFIMAKRTDTTGIWFIYDGIRNPFNLVDLYLQPSSSAAETTYGNAYDFVSNGVKIRNTASDYNASGGTYIFMAFAEHPFRNSLAR